VADEPRSGPVAIRIGRPYRTEEEFLTQEPEALTRTTATLIGAQAKPQGVILRFEVTLLTGEPLLRGEGRVVAFRPETPGSNSALTLRFTRLDARSKALVDRAAALREARGRGSHPPVPAAAPVAPPPAEPPPVAAAASALGEPWQPPGHRPPRPPVPHSQTPTEARVEPVRAPQAYRGPRHAPADVGPATRPAAGPVGRPGPVGPVGPPLAPPADRERLLERLRDRARALPQEAVASILAKPR
jgi:molecular chaperone DnaK